jgi:hypothetical protein
MLVIIFILRPFSGGKYSACPWGRYQRGHNVHQRIPERLGYRSCAVVSSSLYWFSYLCLVADCCNSCGMCKMDFSDCVSPLRRGAKQSRWELTCLRCVSCGPSLIPCVILHRLSVIWNRPELCSTGVCLPKLEPTVTVGTWAHIKPWRFNQ